MTPVLGAALDQFLSGVTSTQMPPQWYFHLIGVALAVALVANNRVWPLVRNLVTLVHEAGHAVVAALAGRRLSGIALHSDTSGVTVSAGKPYGFGMVLTAFSGYTAASTVGIALLGGAQVGRSVATVWVVLILLGLILLLIRNFHGLLVTVASGTAVGLLAWFAPASVTILGLVVTGWFFLAAGIRASMELRSLHKAGGGDGSDAYQLSVLTPFPAGFWVFMMNTWNVVCLFATVPLLFV